MERSERPVRCWRGDATTAGCDSVGALSDDRFLPVKEADAASIVETDGASLKPTARL